MPARLLLLIAAGFAILGGVAAWSLTRASHGLFHGRLPEAYGLREGGGVSYLGLVVGAISEITFAKDANGKPIVDVEVRLIRDDVPLRSGDTASVRTQGILGERQLVIVPGPPGSGELTDRDTLMVTAVPMARPILTPEALDSALARILRDSAGQVRPPRPNQRKP